MKFNKHLHKFVLSFLLSFVFSPKFASAMDLYLAGACYFTNGTDHFIKIAYNPQSYATLANLASTPGGDVTVDFYIYNADPLIPASPPISPVLLLSGNSLDLNYCLDVSSVPPPYYVKVSAKYTVYGVPAAGSPIETHIGPINNVCNVDPETITNKWNGCINYQDGKFTLAVTFTDYDILTWGVMNGYNSYNNNLPQLRFLDPITSILYEIDAFYRSGNTVYYDITTLPISEDQPCVQIEFAYRDDNKVIQWRTADKVICPCTSCPAEFTTGLADMGGNTFSLNTYVPPHNGTINHETWTISQGSTIIYSSPAQRSWSLPNGTYTVCHNVTMADNSECDWCTEICFTGATHEQENISNKGITNPEGSQSCSSEFSIITDQSFGSTFTIQLSPSGGWIYSSEYWTVSQGSSIVYTGSPTLLSLTYGNYRICRTVTVNDYESCTWCNDFCFYGGAGISAERPLTLPQIADDKKEIDIAVIQGENQVNINIDASADEVASLTVYNNLGQLIFTKDNVMLKKGKQVLSHDLPSLVPGIYYFKLHTEKNNVTTKFMVQH